MKRSYSNIAISPLPKFSPSDPQLFKSTLDGTYALRVVETTDISKPAAKPIDEIEEPEEDDVANENRLNQNNARMIQLVLKDLNETQIKAIETEQIDLLTNLRPNWMIYIEGPVDIRCGNIMLEKKHITSIEEPIKNEVGPKAEVQDNEVEVVQENTRPNVPVVHVIEDWDEDDEQDCIVLD